MATGKEVSRFRQCFPQVLAVMVKNILMMVFGMSLGMPTILIARLSDRNDASETISVEDGGISWLGSLNFLSVPVGCLLSGLLTQPIGRKRSMQLISMLFFVAFFLFYMASEAWHVFLALAMCGITGGLLEAPTLIYVVEITCASLRGSLVSTSTLAILVGVITSFTLGALLLWRSMALVNGCVSLFGLITLTFIPESPYWLTEMGRTEDARRSLAWLRGWVDLEDVDEEYQQICDDLNKKVRRSCEVESYRKGSFIKPFLLVSFAFFLAHFGITPINIYAVKIFQQLRVPVDSFLATILIGCVELTASVLLSLVVPRFGKRKLTFLSLAGVCINHILTAITAYVLGSNADDAARYLKWVPLFTILSATFFGYLMVYTLPWIIMGEIFPNQIRDSAAGFSAGTGYVIGFLANKIFLGLVDMATLSGVLLMYSAIELVGIAVMYVWLPETEGKSLDDIMMYFVSRKKREGRVSPGKTDGIENKSYETEENSNTNV
ncbi:facilitated trehalose transporter Tret1-like isoform X2 [Rhynchophorus ferrugineus]|uniref:facilitated trehalose transporter Tret1-like isoform X2 n=1 Tax=Rhynchophorus ferrugineus TaxID=354439 RepID=UPI003FCD1462